MSNMPGRGGFRKADPLPHWDPPSFWGFLQPMEREVTPQREGIWEAQPAAMQLCFYLLAPPATSSPIRGPQGGVSRGRGENVLSHPSLQGDLKPRVKKGIIQRHLGEGEIQISQTSMGQSPHLSVRVSGLLRGSYDLTRFSQEAILRGHGSEDPGGRCSQLFYDVQAPLLKYRDQETEYV